MGECGGDLIPKKSSTVSVKVRAGIFSQRSSGWECADQGKRWEGNFHRL